MIYIYALVDPRTNAIRYVGKSIRPKERLANHCNEKSITYRTNWIREVIASGNRPEIAILEELPDGADWETCECKWIAYGRENGWALTNCTDGGDGVPNLPAHIRRRISQSWIGRKHSAETLVKLSIASKGRTHNAQSKERMRQLMTGRIITWGDKLSKANSKLTDDQVRGVRRMIAEGISQYAIADEFGVHQGTISNIFRGKCYKDVK